MEDTHTEVKNWLYFRFYCKFLGYLCCVNWLEIVYFWVLSLLWNWLFLNILYKCVTGDTCDAGGAHSSGTPGLTLDDFSVWVPGLSVLIVQMVPFLNWLFGSLRLFNIGFYFIFFCMSTRIGVKIYWWHPFFYEWRITFYPLSTYILKPMLASVNCL